MLCTAGKISNTEKRNSEGLLTSHLYPSQMGFPSNLDGEKKVAWMQQHFTKSHMAQDASMAK